MYLVRASGTRKGTGTFYTKPGLAVPTVHRTLEPLAYHVEGDGEDRKLTPKKPEEILALKVCDPAMGSGSFLVAALRYLTDALYESLWYHVYTKKNGSIATTIPEGEISKALFHEDITRYRPDDEKFEEKTKARLKRYVVERCIYGVDINPLAVELAKLSLWVETLDRELPFEFLEHKLKVGNSLVGTWFDRFQDYPIMAWMRDGGDKGHKGVHYKNGSWTKKIKETLSKKVKPELVRIIQGVTTIDEFYKKEDKSEELNDKAIALFEEMHNLPLFGEGFQDREEFFIKKIKNDPDFVKLREAFDLWCSIWFWPGDLLDEDIPTPEKFYKPSEEVMERSREIVKKIKFFHWELEFPDVFVKNERGFTAIIGNPPWENEQPNPNEFFSKYNPIYRTLNRMDQLDWCLSFYKEHKEIERDWLYDNARYRSMSNWVKNIHNPSGNLTNKLKRDQKKAIENIYPFVLQKGRVFTYKLFLEESIFLLRKNGIVGLIIPSGIYSDSWSNPLRENMLNKMDWIWLFSFENKNAIFNIHRSYKFCAIILRKEGKTDLVRTAFMRKELTDWEIPYQHSIPYKIEQLITFSPKSKVFLEIQNNRDIEILNKIYSNSILLGNQDQKSWGMQYTLEFMMNTSAHLFPPVNWWKDKGYKPDEYGRWKAKKNIAKPLIYKGKEISTLADIGLPLYQGVMIYQYDFSAAKYISGTANRAVWEPLSWENKYIAPQFIMPYQQYIKNKNSVLGLKIGIRDVSNATNERGMISSLIYNCPCANVIGVISSKNNQLIFLLPSLVSIFNSFTYDFSARIRLVGMHFNYFVIEETPVISPLYTKRINLYSLMLNCVSVHFSNIWLLFAKRIEGMQKRNWKSFWAITSYERLRLRCIVDAIIAKLYGLNMNDFAWILRNDQTNPKGFWRVDKDKPQELRHTTLALVAFRDLKKMIEKNEGDCDKGIQEFCEQNDGEGWMIPETISFVQRENGVLEFDTSDSKTYEVRSKLGERFLPWQLEGTPEESWKECEMHARNILGDEEFEKFMKDLDEGNDLTVTDVISKATSKMNKDKSDKDKQKNLLEW